MIMIIINNLKLPLDTDFSNLSGVVADRLKISINDIISARLYRKSVDARDKGNVHFCVSVIAEIKNENKIIKKNKNASLFVKKEYIWQKAESRVRPVVIGFGPAGMLAALTLAKAGLNPIVYERGADVDTRTADVQSFFAGGALNPESNVQFGEGGAGTFSDGKLNTGIKDIRCRTILEIFCKFGAPEDILTDAKPHIGTDILKVVVKNIRNEIISLGGEVNFNSKLDGVYFKDKTLESISVNGKKMPCEHLCLCIGHSARDTFKMLYDSGVEFVRKPFAMGVRIEHLQSEINKALYGMFASHPALKAADYKLAVHLPSGRGVYTFCMCPGGRVVASASEDGGVVTNGMSYFARDGKNANSALLVNVTPSDFKTDDPLAGMYFQREIEQRAFEVGGKNYNAPCQRVGDFLGAESNSEYTVEPTYKPNVTWVNLDEVFPKFITDSMREGIVLMDNKLHGFADIGAVITGPETRSSSPVRIIRDKKTMQSNIKGLYPCGEGAGYAGGIMSAAVDGIKVAEMVAINNGRGKNEQ